MVRGWDERKRGQGRRSWGQHLVNLIMSVFMGLAASFSLLFEILGIEVGDERRTSKQ
jgi:hypothetical protein